MDVRAEYDRMLRRKAGLEPHDPGEAPAGDPAVSRVIYALRDLGVRGPSAAVDVLNAAGAAGLTPAQTEAVLAGIRLAGNGTGGPAYIPPQLVGPGDELHDEGDEDPPGASWNGDRDRWYEDH